MGHVIQLLNRENMAEVTEFIQPLNFVGHNLKPGIKIREPRRNIEML
jgi:hypothetical protein